MTLYYFCKGGGGGGVCFFFFKKFFFFFGGGGGGCVCVGILFLVLNIHSLIHTIFFMCLVEV